MINQQDGHEIYDYTIPNPKSPCVKFLEKYEGQYLDHVVKELCRINKYENKKIEVMECYCCHKKTPGRQWIYREKNMSICNKCLGVMKQFTLPLELLAFYGIEHIHFNLEDNLHENT